MDYKKLCMDIFGTDEPEKQAKYENGKSVVELAREYSISRPTVYKYLSLLKK